MKILWVKTDFLHPTTSGGQIRTLETLKRLHRRHEIHFAALDLPQPGVGIRHAHEYCTKAYEIPHHVVGKSGPRFWFELARGSFARVPLAVRRYRSQALLDQVNTLMRRERFDAVICDFLASAANFGELNQVVLFQHNVEAAMWNRHAEQAPTPWHRAYSSMQHKRMLRYEGAVTRAVKRVIAVSQADAELMRTLYGTCRVEPIATGVDLEYFAPPAELSDSQKTFDLIFVGAMDWRPNVDGITWFITEVLPLIRRRRPNCSLAVVGRNPAVELRGVAAHDKHIDITGTVADVRPYLWRSVVSIVPLRIGGGTRLKIYEAMAAKLPVVSTSVGAEGLDIRDGENIALADSPADFAESCLTLLDDAMTRRRLCANAWEMIAACYSWEEISRQFEKLLVE